MQVIHMKTLHDSVRVRDQRIAGAFRSRQIVTVEEGGKATREQVIVLGMETLGVPFLLVALLWGSLESRSAPMPSYARGVVLVLAVLLTLAAVGSAVWFHGKEGLKQLLRELAVIAVWGVLTLVYGMLLTRVGHSHLGFWLVLPAVVGVTFAGFAWGYGRAPAGLPVERRASTTHDVSPATADWPASQGEGLMPAAAPKSGTGTPARDGCAVCASCGGRTLTTQQFVEMGRRSGYDIDPLTGDASSGPGQELFDAIEGRRGARCAECGRVHCYVCLLRTPEHPVTHGPRCPSCQGGPHSPL
jgi:hypothetical protein